MTSELRHTDVRDILKVLNDGFGTWGDKNDFFWKYRQNVYGDSLHLVAYDAQIPVGTVSFWRNDLSSQESYQCVDLTVVPSHRRQGIFNLGVTDCVKRLKGSYIYTNVGTNGASYRGFIKQGWSVARDAPITIHFSGQLIKNVKMMPEVPDAYVRWRFVNHPRKQYYVYRDGEDYYLLSKLRRGLYVMIGRISEDFGLPVSKPMVMFSYDFPHHIAKLPRKPGSYLENSLWCSIGEDIPSYKSDTI